MPANKPQKGSLNTLPINLLMGITKRLCKRCNEAVYLPVSCNRVNTINTTPITKPKVSCFAKTEKVFPSSPTNKPKKYKWPPFLIGTIPPAKGFASCFHHLKATPVQLVRTSRHNAHCPKTPLKKQAALNSYRDFLYKQIIFAIRTPCQF